MFQPILNKIDKAFPDWPVFVFGYSQLMRGLSCACNFAPLCALNLHLTSRFSRAPALLRYRSNKRVPSHYILLHGGGMSTCRLVQAAGRAQGDQASALRANNFDRVTLLTLSHDFDTIKNYPSFLEVRTANQAPCRPVVILSSHVPSLACAVDQGAHGRWHVAARRAHSAAFRQVRFHW